MLLMIDNYDSFTYNIVQYFGELNQEVKVVRNDAVTLEDIERWQPKYLVIGPGPCSPSEAGISIPAIQHFGGKIPLLGVCLGHQSIGQAFGGDIIRAKRVMHGRLSDMYHSDKGIFSNLPNPFSASVFVWGIKVLVRLLAAILFVPNASCMVACLICITATKAFLATCRILSLQRVTTRW